MPLHPQSDPLDSVLERTPDTHIKRPPPFNVLLHNDDYTPMDFVVAVLRTVFGKPEPDAVAIMLDVHEKGTGIAGTYPFAVAESKVAKVHELARHAEHPLRCSLEPV